MKKLIALLLCTVFSFSNLFSKEALTLVSRDAGFFSIFMDVTSILNSYDQGYIRGLNINFGKTGVYYDPNYGDNWWEYYFEPIVLGDMSEPVRYTGWGNEYQLELSNPWAHHNVIKKYIQLKPHVQEKLDAFVEENFSGYYVIGVHYRGTDKITENPRVSYEKMISAINDEVVKLLGKNKKWKIFLATDEHQFMLLVKSKYRNKVCCLDAFRAMDEHSPVHTDANRSPYRCGEEALLDCILLSKTNVLLRTESNLSACTRYFNPSLDVKIVSP